MKRFSAATSFLVLCFLQTVIGQPRDFTRWVNPFIGTGGHGHTFPGATVPFGMVQLSPDTRIDNWDGSSGYHYSDDVIYGFSHTHLSGTGIPDGCDILVSPRVGDYATTIDFFAPSKFDHANEKAEPGYYSVKLDRDNILAELTSTTRVGFHRYTFPKGATANLTIDLTWRDKVIDSQIDLRDRRRFEGYRRSNSWAKDQTVYFAGEFSKDFSGNYFQDEIGPGKLEHVPNSNIFRSKNLKSTLEFKTDDGKPILLKIAISFVSIEGARANLAAELPGWDFDKVRADAKAAWNKELSKIEVSGGTNDQTITFYTALYHTMIHPNVFNDVDGKYFGHDRKVHQVPRHSSSISQPADARPSRSSAPPLGVRRSYASPEDSNFARGSAAELRRSRGLVGQARKSIAFPHTEGRSPEEPPEGGTQSGTQWETQSGTQWETQSGTQWETQSGAQTGTQSATRNGTQGETHGGIQRRTSQSSSNPKSKIQNPKSEQYTVFSLWDTFRAAHPLYTIIDQKRTADFINTFIRIYEQGGRLPVWELWGEETDTMIGYHAVSVIADAMAKNVKGFDYDKAYAAAKHSAELDHFGLAAYKKKGFISSEDENESVSKTLEYAYDDWCLMSMAGLLYNRRSLGEGGGTRPGDAEYLKRLGADVDLYRERSGNFANLFDAETGFFRPRRNGGFIKPFAPEEVTFHFTEGNAWQYSFFVPHDVTRLITLMGGEKKFVAKLDELFTTETKLSGREQPDITGLIGQYAHGNEPSHHIAYLYDYTRSPSKTQQRVRQILDNFYKPTPDGLIGNEDCGQMSAWYVLSASGFYSVLPGTTRYDLGTPLFKQVVFNLENGKKFIIRAPKVSPSNIYINSAKWNGAVLPVPYIVQEQIMSGGVLTLDMSDKPNDTAFESVSTSTVYGETAVAPVIEGDRVFRDKMSVTISTPNPRASITYTIDDHGEEFARKTQVYTGPFTISDTATIKAVATAPGFKLPSKTVEAHFQKRWNDWTVKIASPYSSQYTGGGDDAIVDGLRGTANFASGEWQGYEGKTFEAVIDLQRPKEIKSLGGSFLQSARSWIWMPDRIEFEISNDGVNFRRVAEIKPGFPLQEMEPATKEFWQSITPTRARYVRVRAFNFGKIPAWHPGAGGDPWIFVDEILVD